MTKFCLLDNPTTSFNKHNTNCKTLNPEPVKNLENMQGDQNSVTQPQIMSSQQDSEKPTKLCEEADKHSVSEQKRMVTEATENPRMKRTMSNWERDQLGLVLQDLAEEYMDEILQIVAKRNSNMTTPDGDGEIEVVIKALDNETMWDLHTFMRLKFKPGLMN